MGEERRVLEGVKAVQLHHFNVHAAVFVGAALAELVFEGRTAPGFPHHALGYVEIGLDEELVPVEQSQINTDKRCVCWGVENVQVVVPAGRFGVGFEQGTADAEGDDACAVHTLAVGGVLHVGELRRERGRHVPRVRVHVPDQTVTKIH